MILLTLDCHVRCEFANCIFCLCNAGHLLIQLCASGSPLFPQGGSTRLDSSSASHLGVAGGERAPIAVRWLHYTMSAEICPFATP